MGSDPVRLIETRDEWLLAQDVRPGREASLDVVGVRVRRSADDDHVGPALLEHGVEVVERWHVESSRRALPLPRVRIACADHDGVGNARERRKMKREAGVA